jgi:hypothetical protein
MTAAATIKLQDYRSGSAPDYSSKPNQVLCGFQIARTFLVGFEGCVSGFVLGTPS